MSEAPFLAAPRPTRLPIRARARRRSRSRMSFLIGPLATPVSVFVVTLILIVAHQGKLLEVTFMPMAVAVSYWLYRRYPVHYVSMVCWLIFLTPEVRRFADFYNGVFNQTSIIMMTPFFAASLAGLSILNKYRYLGQRRALPLIMMLIAIVYGYVLGVAQFGIMAATYGLINWLQPIFIAWHLIVTWREYPTYRRVLTKTYVYGAIVMGAYGIYQYVAPPPWIVFWMAQSGMESSSGSAVPFGMRICSTMNSTGPFALTMMVALLMLVSAPGKAKFFAGIVGLPSLMFTLVRTSWGGLVIGLVYPLAMLDSKSRLRLIMVGVCVVGLCAPAVMIDQVAAPLLKRLQTIQDIQNDSSFQARSGFYTNFSEIASRSFAGHGIGSTGIGAKLAADPSQVLSVVDSGVVDVVWVLGWPGTLLYIGGVLMLLWRAFVASLLRSDDRFAVSGVGASIAILAIMVMVDTLQGSSGMLFMIGTVIPVIGLRYVRHMQRLNALSGAARAGRPS
ncbi:conserved membrane hypothetical protein [Paraburkholderia unamae]|uniref:hypothetical protein n=1 Tax=Paraburkholderia unamae TaxID=219649 RepID=UPI001CADBD69|nr:hypothetical protein [Paraburkholderia unamae]CAG9250597.1 conserved membrane hypothetical protein [Paraburkholderia unamae]